MAALASVLIVGAGPVGLTAAAHLHRHGVACRIVDRSPGPTETSKALVLWPRSLETLDDLGIVDHFISAGIFANAAQLHGGGRLLARVLLEQPDTRFPRPLMLAQSETERLLTEHLGRVGLQVERSTELIGFVDHGDQVVAILRHNGRDEEFSCEWLIGCDGAHSAARKGLSMEFSGKAEPNDWILADCRMDGPIPHDEISLYWHSQGVLAIFPFAAGRCRVIADMGAAKALDRPLDPTLSEVQTIVDRRGPSAVKLSDPIWLSGFRIHERKVSNYRRGRVFLAGDAAHIHSPAGGQGMNTGMQDAYNLAWKLAIVQSGHGKRDPLLDSYDIERGAVGEEVLRAATLLTKIATLRNPIGQFLRNRFVGLAAQLPAFRKTFARNLSELSIHYPISPLNGERSDSGGVQSGERVPDGILHEPVTLAERRLLSIAHGPGHNLLLFSATNDAHSLTEFAEIATKTHFAHAGLIQVHLIIPEKAAFGTPLDAFDRTWLDPDRRFATKLGITASETLLVRPDGYLGYRCRSSSWNDLRAHLDRYLIAREH